MKQWLALVMLSMFIGATPANLPYAALQDIPDTAVVGRSLRSCGEDQVVLALAIHHPTKGYFMLWTSPKRWIMAPFGLTEPGEGVLARVVWRGTWEDKDNKLYFRHADSLRIVPSNENHKIMCAWLYPTET